MLVFDVETDGLLDDLEKIHCINIVDRKTGKEERYSDHEFYPDTGEPTHRVGTIEEAVRRLQDAAEICGHNIVDYDIPAIQKVYPWFNPRGRIHDTRVYTRLIYTNLTDRDFTLLRKGKLPLEFQKKGYIGSHSLRAWGIRLGFPKDDFDPMDFGHTWKTVPFSTIMDDYCMQDVRVTLRLIELVESKNYSSEAMELEIEVQKIISRQQRHGFLFDVEAARKLTVDLQVRKLELETECRKVFAPWLAVDGRPFTPKRMDRKRGYEVGATFQRVKLVEFNPGSRDHIANRLMKLRGWVPKDFTPEGKPKIDETILSSLPYPEAKLLTEYLTVSKRLGQIAEGKEAWLNAVGPDGRIHGAVNTNGAVTGRMTHFKPNVAQVPRVGSPYGAECRALFCVPKGKKQVGCDAEGLELRILGHYMARYDGGEYADTVVNGDKNLGTDVHSVNKRIVQLNTRDAAKTFIYALIYGAGDFKLGQIVFDDFTDEQRAKFLAKQAEGGDPEKMLVRLGKRARARIMEGLPALAQLTEAVKAAAKKNGVLRGLDGRLLHVRAEHSALNTLLQAGGAVVMKKGLVMLDRELQAMTLSPVEEYEFIANIHDEWQIETLEEYAEEIGRQAADAIRAAGEHFKLRCPLAGSYAIGDNWLGTH